MFLLKSLIVCHFLSRHGQISPALQNIFLLHIIIVSMSGPMQYFLFPGRNGSEVARSTGTGTWGWSSASSRTWPSRPTPRTAAAWAWSQSRMDNGTSSKIEIQARMEYSVCCSLLKPDFLLIRQDPRDAGEDFKSALLGFQYGQVPSINSLESVYNFQVSDLILKNVFLMTIMMFRTSHGCMLISLVSKGNLEKKTFPWWSKVSSRTTGTL